MDTKSIMTPKRVLCLIGFCSAFLAAQERSIVDLGSIIIPEDMEFRNTVLPKGEYRIALFKGTGRSAISLGDIKPDAQGFVHSRSIDATVTEVEEHYPQSKVEVSVVTESGDPYVQILVYLEDKSYKSLWKCASKIVDRSLLAVEKGPVDPVISNEVKLLREVHNLLDEFAGEIWPGWDGYKILDFTLTFPNRVVILVTHNSQLPERYKILPDSPVSGKAVYIDRSNELKGHINPAMSVRGHGDASGVTASLLGSLEERDTARDLIEKSRLMRMLLYVHEAFHAFQMKLMTESGKAGTMKKREEISRDFDANLEYSVYADVEGQALLKAFEEKDEGRALEALKDSWMARKIRRKTMPQAVAVGEEMATRNEGTATYSSLYLARLIKDAGYGGGTAGENEAVSSAFQHAGEYFNREAVSMLRETAGRALDVDQRYYIYGAFQCFLLDRFFPRWKEGLFENDLTLDEVLDVSLKLPEEEQRKIEERIKTGYAVQDLLDKHGQVIKERDEDVRAFMSRKGLKYRIDLRRAQRGFDIRPRKDVVYKGGRYFARGVEKFVFGSLKLESVDTPMRYFQGVLEWIDTETRSGEKGYELTFDGRDGDLYKRVMLKTRGFTMTANAVRIVEEEGTVTILVID